jgi:hypothetical protein
MRQLRQEFPVDLPIKLKRRKLNGLFGYASRGSNNYIICIDNKLEPSVAVDTLLHEIAHILVWGASVDHGQEWGKAYSRIYRWAEKNYFPKLDAGDFN